MGLYGNRFLTNQEIIQEGANPERVRVLNKILSNFETYVQDELYLNLKIPRKWLGNHIMGFKNGKVNYFDLQCNIKSGTADLLRINGALNNNSTLSLMGGLAANHEKNNNINIIKQNKDKILKYLQEQIPNYKISFGRIDSIYTDQFTIRVFVNEK